MNWKHIACGVGLFASITAVAVMLLQSGADSLGISDGDTPSLRVGTNVWPGYEPLYIARNLGHYNDQTVRLVECSSASQVIHSFRNNNLEVAALTLDEVLLLKDNGYDVKIILVTDVSDGGDVILGNAGIRRLTDLHGRQVGAESTALGAYVLTQALRSVGMSVADVNVVPLEVDEHERAFSEGKVDAVVTFEPVSSRLIAGGAVRLFDSTQIPDQIVDVLAVRGSTIDATSEQLAVLLQGWFLGLRHLQEQPQDAGRQMAERMQLSSRDALASLVGLRIPDLDENLSLLGGSRPRLVDTAEQLADIMIEQELLHREIDVTQLFSAAILKQLHDNSQTSETRPDA